jgi:hypothetical protein
MIQIHNQKELSKMILLLEIEQAHKQKILKDQFHATFESLKPINILKTTISEAISAPEVGTNLVDNLIGMASGFLSNKVLVGNTDSPIKKVAGSILQMIVSNVVSHHTGGIVSSGKSILQLLSKMTKRTVKYPDYH